MVRFDHAFLGVALDDVGVDGALKEEVHFAEFGRFFLEDADEFLADDLAFLFGVVDARQLSQETFPGVDHDEVHLEGLLEDLLDGFRLVLAHEAVVDEDAGQLVADGAVDERRTDRAVDAAGEGAEDLLVADGLFDLFHGVLNEGFDRPVLLEAAGFEEG